MVCLYCGGSTRVTNSRPQKRLNRTWRRRECQNCQAIFTTQEAVELSGSMVVRSQKMANQAPFSRDKLFISILRAVGHRDSPLSDADALSATVIALLLQNTSEAVIEPSQIVQTTLDVLQRFDTAAAVQYRAYHKT